MGAFENGSEELKHIFGAIKRERQEEVRGVWVAGEMDIEVDTEALYRWILHFP